MFLIVFLQNQTKVYLTCIRGNLTYFFLARLEAVRVLSQQISLKLEALESENYALKSKIEMLESGLVAKVEELTTQITLVKEQVTRY